MRPWTLSNFQAQRWVSLKLSRLLRGHPVLQSEILLAVAILISLVCGSAAVALHRSIELIGHMMYASGSETGGGWHPLLTVLTPAGGGLLAGLLLHYLVPEARGSGVPQVKLDLAMRGGVIPFKVALGKFVGTAIAVGSGASVGREGPTVQICASIGSSLARWFPMTATQLRIMVHAACVSGVAAAFNTPIAGMTFVMEEIIGDLNARHVSYFIFAAVGAAMTSRYFLGNEPVFDVPQYALGHPAEMLLYILLGGLAALVSVAFIRLLVWSIGRFQALTIPAYLKPALGGILVGGLALYLPQVLGSGYATVTDAMHNRIPLTLMALLVLAKFVATVISYSSGTAGGLFAPSLFLGAMLGGSLASLFDVVLDTIRVTPGAFALVGMGAVFVGIIRTPMTSIFIIFEMTNDYALILPLMLANMTSYALARYLEPDNVYEAILAANRVHLPAPQDYHLLEESTADEAMLRQPKIVPPEMPIGAAAALFEGYPYESLPVATDDHRLLGMVALSDLRPTLAQGEQDKPVLSVATTENLVYAHPDHTLHWVIQQMGERDVSTVPVVTRGHESRLLGVLSMSDIVRVFTRSKIAQQPHGAE
jgi:CIC family chloride channel protein